MYSRWDSGASCSGLLRPPSPSGPQVTEQPGLLCPTNLRMPLLILSGSSNNGFPMASSLRPMMFVSPLPPIRLPGGMGTAAGGTWTTPHTTGQQTPPPHHDSRCETSFLANFRFVSRKKSHLQNWRLNHVFPFSCLF